jgi:hypothetical protein
VRRDYGQVIWQTTEERWFALCGVPQCKHRSSHEDPQVAIDAIRRHLIRAHLSDAVDLRQEPSGD